MVNRLIEIISKEAALFESFLELLEQQKAMLVASDIAGLNRVTEEQRRKLVESQVLNRERELLVERIKAANEIDGDLTVSRLLDLVDAGQAQRLRELKDLVLDLNKKINETRNSNALLLNQSREFISRTMAALARINNPESTYAPAGRTSDRRANVIMDRRA
jgi:flagellar biosynthesis/type III secretory pathway chaperone